VCAQWSVTTAEVVAGGIGTGISVIPIGYWSPTALASAAATVAEISGGKFVLGIGSGAIQSPAFRRSLGLDDGLRPIGAIHSNLRSERWPGPQCCRYSRGREDRKPEHQYPVAEALVHSGVRPERNLHDDHTPIDGRAPG